MNTNLSTLSVLLNFIVLTSSYKGKIPLGAIFDKADDHIKTGLRYEIQDYNEHAGKNTFTLEATEEDIDIEDSYKLAMSICQHMYGGIFVLVGSRAFKSQNIIRSYTQRFKIPFLTTSMPYDVTGYNGYEIFMKPPVTHALKAMIHHFRYTELYYVYDTDAGLIRFQALRKSLEATESNDTERVKINMYRIQNISRAYDDLKILDRIYKGKKVKSILMDFSSESSYSTVLDQIRELGMNKRGYTYLLGTMNILDMNLDRFTHGGVNITGFQLVDYSAKNVEEFIKGWKKVTANIWAGAGREHISVDAALAVDSVTIVQRTIQKMLQNDSDVFLRTFRRGDLYNNNMTKGIPCNMGIPWMHGETIIRNIKQIGHRGLTGHLKFTKNGLRKGYKLDVYRIGLNYGPHKVGDWRPVKGFRLANNDDGNKNNSSKGEKVYIVTSILEKPFLMLKKTNPEESEGKPLIGNDQYEGFCADLIRLLSKMCNFEYIIRPNKFRVYGKEIKEAVVDTDGTVIEPAKWNGMIGELINEEADVAAAPLTITMDREEVVHFSKPFMNSGISIMIQKPEKQKRSVFSFMKPFSISLWMCIVIGYVVVSVGIFLVSRFSPTEWKKIRIRTRTEFLNKFTFRSSLWFSMGSLMLQGSDTCPRSAAGRIIGGTWWLAVLIVISSYTANLAAFLTIEKLLMPISSADDLAKHPDMTYGTLASGSTQSFFKKSNVPTYVTMWNFMNSDHSMFVNSTQEGVERVRNAKGKYAFLLESVYNEYFNNQEPCNTMQVGPSLNSKGYGIATRKGAELRDKISIAVLELFEDGTLIKLKQTWWVDKGTCGVPGAHSGSKKKSLSLSNVAGVFYILIGGLVLAIMVGVTHFLRSKSKGKLAGVLVVNSEASRSLLSDYREGQQTENGPNNSDIHRSVPVKGILMNTCKLQAADNTCNHNGRTELYESRSKPFW